MERKSGKEDLVDHGFVKQLLLEDKMWQQQLEQMLLIHLTS